MIKPQELVKAMARGQMLLVGAGGIGCELLKNHMLTSFFHFDLIDLGAIDVNNLNRQFLFKKKKSWKIKDPGCQRKCTTVLPDSIMNPDYNVGFFSTIYNGYEFFRQQSCPQPS